MSKPPRVSALKVLRWTNASITAHAAGGYLAILPTPPSGNRSVRRGATHQYGSPAWDDYQIAVVSAARRWKPVCIEPPATVHVQVRWYRARKAGDLDNRLKTALDSLQGILYRRDSQITKIEAVRLDDDVESHHGVSRIEVLVTPGRAA